MTRRRWHWPLLLVVLLPGLAFAQAKGLDELLKKIQESGEQGAKINQEREARFLRDKDAQAAMLQKAEAEFAAAKGRSDAAKARYEANQRAIAELKTQLGGRAGDYTQVSAAVRQVATDFRGFVLDSPVTAQFPERLEFLDTLANSQELPGVAELEKLWFTLQQEMTENGKVLRFDAEVIAPNGEGSRQQVTRVGVFSVFADGQYLVTAPGSGLLSRPVHQPERGYRSMAREFDEAEGWSPILIDPTHGALLSQMSQRPSLGERIEQGEEVGLIIIALGLVGAVLAIWQLVYLLKTGRLVQAQLRDVDHPRDDNPLGRVLAAFRGDPAKGIEDPEVVELRLSEAVLREVPKLERFQSFLRLVVAAGPLLGLIGTVVGMIITFQVITEQGAGDPRLMAAGISQAMIATVLGLGIAVPLLFVNSLLAARSRVLVQILDEQSTGLLAERLERSRA